MSETKVAGSGVFVPARRIPAPPTVSPQAQALLANPPAFGPPAPDPNDRDAWRSYIAAGAAWLESQMAESAKPYPAEIVTHTLDGVPLYEVVPATLSPGYESCAIFYVHGGAYIHGAGLAGAYMSQPLAGLAGMRAFCVDYRMPPDHPYPAGLEDTVDAYRWVLERYEARNIVVAGGSAGGGLAAALVLKARDIGLAMPGACILATPEADLTESGDSFETNDTVDVVGGHRLTDSIALYANGHNLRDPYLSPIFGDFSKGFPPTILTTGTRDLFLSNTVIMHRALLRAGMEAELHVWEAMPHGGFFGAPEDKEILAEQVRFIRKRLGGG
ncbi:MAG TPA: alpha/beta hydrolase fold domain-containing protein [Acetobacteraceae bacterium]|nr:alpha/beta hydrolase fold domain-containing protein [Acetobacteraceae bacterium]